MGDVRASPPCSIVMVSYQKCRRRLRALVEILKMIRCPIPVPGRGPSGENLFVGNDFWWYVFSFFPLLCMWFSFLISIEPSAVDTNVPNSLVDREVLRSQSDPGMLAFIIVYVGGALGHIFSLYSVAYWHREMSPFRLIGAKAKFMIEVIPMIVAAALHHLLKLNYGFLFLLLGCVTYFHTFAHFLHAAYDIRGKDVLLGSSMLVIVHRLSEDLLAGALALSFCLGLSLYRYMTYCTPELPKHPKKELEELLPC